MENVAASMGATPGPEMSWFLRRREREAGQASQAGEPAGAPAPCDARVDEALHALQTPDCAVSAGDYVTDGCSLFRVEDTLVDERSGELYVELENCGTMELIVCSARALADRELRGISPVGTSKLAGGALG